VKRILIILFIFKLLIPFAFSQNGDHVGGGVFSKRIEYNLLLLGDGYNFNSKGDVEKLFFGDFNAPVEFFYDPSFDGASGFRIVRDTLKEAYILEIKYVSNYKEARGEALKKYPLSTPLSIDEVMDHANIPKETLELIEQRKNNWEKYFAERNKLFKIESHSFPVSNRFAEKFYERMVSVIDNFKARGIPPIIEDGYSVTFRNIVDDEVWSLKVHIPSGNALKLTNLCKKIIEETLTTSKPDEFNYIKLLEDF